MERIVALKIHNKSNKKKLRTGKVFCARVFVSQSVCVWLYSWNCNTETDDADPPQSGYVELSRRFLEISKYLLKS